jgi:UDP-2,3-diacylglucosamine pyrophosphatase LpxH
VLDAIIISDIHLGSTSCQAEAVWGFLSDLPHTQRLVINGDLLEGTEYRLAKKHWRVLSKLRKLSDRLELVWVRGNHDPDADHLAHLLGAAYVDEYQFRSSAAQVLCVHGDAWDNFLTDHPLVSYLADWCYLGLQRLSRRLALKAKRRSKTHLRCAQKIEDGAVAYARKLGCAVVCCGHTHHALTRQAGDIRYCNSGCWTDVSSAYLAVSAGQVELRHFATPDGEVTTFTSGSPMRPALAS